MARTPQRRTGRSRRTVKPRGDRGRTFGQRQDMTKSVWSIRLDATQCPRTHFAAAPPEALTMHLNGECPGVKAVTRCGAKSCPVWSYRQHFRASTSRREVAEKRHNTFHVHFSIVDYPSRAQCSAAVQPPGPPPIARR